MPDKAGAPKLSGKGPKLSGKGPKLSGKGSPNGNGATTSPEDIFRRVTELGGFLIVAFVAPVGGGGQAADNATGQQDAAVSQVASEARERNRELAELLATSVKKPKQAPTKA